MRIISVVGARPQFVKAAAVSRAVREYNAHGSEHIDDVILHTGQHFDRNMSEVFFAELEIEEPVFNLAVSGLSHGAMTGRMLEQIETVLDGQLPDIVFLYGDTNSTLAGALAASKMHIPVAHVEAGLRSFNMRMPEEINRILSDRVSSFLFCPTETAVTNLHNEGIESGVHLVGDVMYDVTLYYRDKARSRVSLDDWGVEEGNYVLSTIHRAENTNDPARLCAILEALREISTQTAVIMPLHPRTRKLLADMGKQHWLKGLKVVEPVSYLEMLRLEQSAKVILTDSGGIQKEAYFNRVPCLTLRDETEWVETVALGWNEIVGADRGRILDAYYGLANKPRVDGEQPYGDGQASQKILDIVTGKQ